MSTKREGNLPGIDLFDGPYLSDASIQLRTNPVGVLASLFLLLK
jgi:hypothetical protein